MVFENRNIVIKIENNIKIIMKMRAITRPLALKIENRCESLEEEKSSPTAFDIRNMIHFMNDQNSNDLSYSE